MCRKNAKGAPGLDFETWDPRDRDLMDTRDATTGLRIGPNTLSRVSFAGMEVFVYSSPCPCNPSCRISMKGFGSKEFIHRMRKPHRLQGSLLFLCCLFLSPSPLALAQSDLSGYWALHIPNGDGTVRDTYFELKKDCEPITGTLLGRGPNPIPISGTFKDGKLQFATVPPATATPSRPFRPLSY